MVHSCMDLLIESQSLCGTSMLASIIKVYRSTAGASEHCLQCNLEITRDITYFGPSSGLTNVLELGDIRGLQPNTVWNKPCTNLNGAMMELKSST